ncbi:MAG: D-2-hydroxyacid dehydrogenase family protein [Betaproteobacteria bacterium]|nr:D-2-hydroxyacid dehydrogenase family protein [Betaproteobacteria bacterium]
MTTTRIAVLDDWQGVAKGSADWTALESRATLTWFENAFESEDAAAAALADFDILIAMRERTAFPATLIARLPKLRMIALTGARSWTLDTAACTARGIVVSTTGGQRATAATAEIALGLLLAAARAIPRADASMREGVFQRGVPAGDVLDGKVLGLLGLGKIGSRMARYGHALGMRVIAWSQNMTAELAQAGGAELVDKDTLLAASDALSLHVVLSDRTRGIIGAGDLARMKRGAIIVNTSRGPLIDESALLAALRAGHVTAALDVFDHEPLPSDHPLRALPNTVLTPHQGYCAREIYEQFYSVSIENVIAFLDGQPVRLLDPDVRPA